MIRLRDLVVRYGAVQALTCPALDLAEGDALAVTGPNGSGKSTLLRVLAGLERPTEGRVEGLLPPGRAVLVHQRPYLLRGTARDNVAWALRVADRPAREATTWLDRLGAASFAARRARDLSGGERRRVAIARALAVRPELLLLDEPFAALDAAGVAAVCAAIEAHEGTLVVASPGPTPAHLPRRLALEAAAG